MKRLISILSILFLFDGSYLLSRTPDIGAAMKNTMVKN